MNKWEAVGGKNLFFKKPIELCPRCKCEMDAEFWDNGFGRYSVQVGPWHCYDCGFTEGDDVKQAEIDKSRTKDLDDYHRSLFDSL
jgi:predicted Zn-ribbon and HTH transcriptional regulator